MMVHPPPVPHISITTPDHPHPLSPTPPRHDEDHNTGTPSHHHPLKTSPPPSSSPFSLLPTNRHRYNHPHLLLFFLLLLLSLSLLLFSLAYRPARGQLLLLPSLGVAKNFLTFQGKGQGGNAEGEEGGGSSPEGLVRRLVSEYRVDFNAELPPEETRGVWEVAADWVNEREVIPPRAPELGAVLHALSSSPIETVDNSFEGTQLKLILTLAGGQRVVFKPKWYERDFIVEGPPSAGRDRHNGEVAAFHLSRIVEFRRTPLAVGRTISLRADLIPSVPEDMLDTFYEEDGETCFYGRCEHCAVENALCTTGDSFEGAVIMWLPPGTRLQEGRNPWRHSFKDKLMARLDTESEDYCSIVRQIEPFANNSHLLLELIDVTVFDYLTGNADRHHYDVIAHARQGMMVMLDNGKSFGNPYQDERSILAPLYQCCIIRHSTWQRLSLLQNGTLSSVLREVLRGEPLHPVLTDQHLQALDRRLHTVLQEVDLCLQRWGHEAVFVGPS